MKNLLIVLTAFTSLSSYANILPIYCESKPSAYGTTTTVMTMNPDASANSNHFEVTINQTIKSESDNERGGSTTTQSKTTMKNLACGFVKSDIRIFTCSEDIRDTNEEVSGITSKQTYVPGIGEAFEMTVTSPDAKGNMAARTVTFAAKDCRADY